MSYPVTVRWLGHSAFMITAGEHSLALDPFQPGSVPGFGDIDETADIVLCSHGHYDHGYTEAVKLTGSHDVPFTVTELSTYHDDVQGEKRGKNTIHIISVDDVRIAHLGDIGCELTDEQASALHGVDVLLIPVGGFYTIDAAAAKSMVDIIEPRITVPMHYRTERFGFPVLAPIEDFLALCSNYTALHSDTFVVNNEVSGVIVLDYPEK